MSEAKHRILVVELSDQLAELVRLVLHDAGYDVTTSVCGPTSFQQAEATNPDAIVLDLGPHLQTCGWQLLDELRTRVDTQGIPVVVIGDSEKLLQDAKQNFNVRQELLKPWDIDTVLDAVKAALSGVPLLPHPAPPPTTSKLSALAADAISHQSDAIMASWLDRVQAMKILGPSAHVPVRVLVGNISVWLVGLVSVLRYGPEMVSGRSEIRGKLLKHIVEAKEHGITLVEIIRQYEILHDEVWAALENADLSNLTKTDLFALARTLDTALDEVLVQIAHVYTTHSAKRAAS